MNKRKLTRESLTELAMRMPVLSEEVQRSYVGGYKYDDKACFFNCLEYFAKEVCGNQDVDWHFFDEAYFKGDGDFPKSSVSFNEYMNGPNIIQSGNLNPQIFNFFSHYFNVEGSGWLMGNNDIQTLFASGSVDNTAIMAIINTGGTDGDGARVAHCVILQSYDADTNTYTYYDPSISGTENEKIKTVDGAQMMFAARAGCK